MWVVLNVFGREFLFEMDPEWEVCRCGEKACRRLESEIISAEMARGILQGGIQLTGEFGNAGFSCFRWMVDPSGRIRRLKM
jgi:hypothetical protein